MTITPAMEFECAEVEVAVVMCDALEKEIDATPERIIESILKFRADHPAYTPAGVRHSLAFWLEWMHSKGYMESIPKS